MPGASSPADELTTLTALLDAAPSLAWQRTFITRSEPFKIQRQLDDVRLIGSHINLVGRSRHLRTMAPAIQGLVIEVSRFCGLRDRTTTQAPGSQVLPASDAVALEPTDVRVSEVALVAKALDTQSLLSEVSRLTGMRFCAIARVTEQRWTACAVHDLLDFGLLPGHDLILETTICNELRQGGKIITFNDASTDACFSHHHTPRIYGFRSYISVPVVLHDGTLFGTLCALDPEPARLDEDTITQIAALASSVADRLSTALKPAPLPAVESL